MIVPRWVVGCPECNQEFTHSEIDSSPAASRLDPFARFADKPEIPEKGVSLECPNCKQVSLYKRYQLVYRAT